MAYQMAQLPMTLS